MLKSRATNTGSRAPRFHVVAGECFFFPLFWDVGVVRRQRGGLCLLSKDVHTIV